MRKSFWDYPLRKHHRLCDQIRSITTPLIEAFEMTHFCYFFVNEQGHSACLSTYPEWVEFYLHHNLFLHNPFLRSPKLIPEGVFFTKSFKDPGYLESKRHAKDFGIDDSIVLTSKEQGKLKGFCFGFRSRASNDSLFVNELPLLKRFCHEFEKRAKRSLLDLESEPFDIRTSLGETFHQRQDGLFLSHRKRGLFLAKLKLQLPDLSKREKECLSFYLQGETARSIAETLELSSRTVESYLENIKNKLNCYGKTELLKRAQELSDYGLLLP